MSGLELVFVFIFDATLLERTRIFSLLNVGMSCPPAFHQMRACRSRVTMKQGAHNQPKIGHGPHFQLALILGSRIIGS